jgi:glycosyltransferase involved in cell wall biosynthesis
VPKDIERYKRIYSLVDYIIVHTDESKKRMIQDFNIFESKISVIQHGIIGYEFEEKELYDEIEIIKQQYNLNDKLVFSLLGSQSRYKGSDILYQAWLSCQDLAMNDKIVCIMAGKVSSDLKDLNIQSSKNLIVINKYLSNLEFQALLKLTDVALMPYVEIDQSGLLLSIIKGNIPYCTSDIGELAEPIRRANIGWIFNSTEIPNVSATILDIAQHPYDIQHKKDNIISWQDLMSEYGWAKSTAMTRKLYTSII